MVPAKLLQDVMALPVEDREEIAERLQENLLADPQAMPPSEEQARELDRRYAESVANPGGGHTLDEVRAMFDQRNARRTAPEFGDSLFEVLGDVRLRPTLYLSDRTVESLHSFISGYLLARGEVRFVDAGRWMAFVNWMQAELRPHVGSYNWARLLRLYSQDTVAAFERFFELVDEFSRRVAPPP